MSVFSGTAVLINSRFNISDITDTWFKYWTSRKAALTVGTIQSIIYAYILGESYILFKEGRNRTDVDKNLINTLILNIGIFGFGTFSSLSLLYGTYRNDFRFLFPYLLFNTAIICPVTVERLITYLASKHATLDWFLFNTSVVLILHLTFLVTGYWHFIVLHEAPLRIRGQAARPQQPRTAQRRLAVSYRRL